MRIECTYYADDGTEFDTEEECLAYERDMHDCSDAVHFYDEHLVRVNDLKTIANTAIYAYIVNKKKAKKFFELIYGLFGQDVPDCYFEDENILKWDANVEEWFNLTAQSLILQAEIQVLMKRELHAEGG